MEPKTILHDQGFDLPIHFFEQLTHDISLSRWNHLLQKKPILKEALLEGFSTRSHKLSNLLKQPQLQVRLRRLARSSPAILEAILTAWGQDQIAIVAFLEMLDRSFLLDNWDHLKNLLGPERFFAGLSLLDYLQLPEVQERLGEAFWQRQVEAEMLDVLVPVFNLWKIFIEEYPQAAKWLREIWPGAGMEQLAAPSAESAPALPEHPRNEEKKLQRLQFKLEREQQRRAHLEEDVNRLHRENEQLQQQLQGWQEAFQQRLQEKLVQHHRQWLQRYQTTDERVLEESQKCTASLLKRADRAFALQQQADEQYGLVAGVRQDLLHLELYLEEVERIYADSLVVHAEVSKVKEALLEEKRRLLQLPGIEKIIRREPRTFPAGDLRRQIYLLPAVPDNLSRIQQVQELVDQLANLDFINDPQPLLDAIQQKKRQIFEMLYDRFLPVQRADRQIHSIVDLDDFVESNFSKQYDLFIDGYNILLKVEGEQKTRPGFTLSAVRDDFITAVSRKSFLFRRVYLIFDGVDGFKDRRDNMEIIYSNKIAGETADTIIIQTLQSRNDKQAVLVTADREIIEATDNKWYAVIDPYDFYMFVYDVDFPVFHEE